MALILSILLSLTANAWNTPSAIFASSKPPWTWTGAANDGNFSNGANWCGSYSGGTCKGQATAPPSSATLYFDNTCTTSCNVSLPSDQTFEGLVIQSNYSGTFDMNGSKLTLGGGGFTMRGGTFNQGSGQLVIGAGVTYAGYQPFMMTGGAFNGGSADIVIGDFGAQTNGGTMMLSGGTFRSTSANLKIHVATLSMIGLSSFNHNNGTVWLESPSNWLVTYGMGAFNYNVLRLDIYATKQVDFNSEVINVAGHMTIRGVTNGIAVVKNGTFVLSAGNLYHLNYNVVGNALFKFTGSGLQLVDNSAAQAGNYLFPTVWAANAAMSGIVRFTSQTWLTGYLNNAATNMGSVDLNGQDVRLYGSSYNGTFDSDLTTFPGLTIEGSFSSAVWGFLKVNGNLLINAAGTSSTATGLGKIQVSGDVTIAGNAASSQQGVALEMIGATNQSIDVTAFGLATSLIINKPSGVLSFVGTPTFPGSFNYISGGVTIPAFVRFQRSTGIPQYTFNGLVFNNVEIFSAGSYQANLNDDFVINGNLTLRIAGGSFSASAGKKILLSGNLYNDATYSNGFGTTVGTLRLVGGNQTIDFSASSAGTGIPNLEIASSGTVTVIGTISVPSIFQVVSGTLNMTSSTLQMTLSPQISAPGVMFNNVKFSSNGNAIISSGPLQVGGLLELSSAALGRTITGNIDAYGDVLFSANGYSGTTAITLRGNNSTLTRNAGTAIPTGTITVAKAAGQKVSLGSSLALNTNQSLSVTSGQVDIAAAAQALTISGSGALSLSSGTSVKLSGGTLNVGGSNIAAGAYSSGTIIP